MLSHTKSLGFAQSLADACVMRLVWNCLVTVVHVDDIFAVGRKARYDQFCEDLNRLVPINNPSQLRRYAGCGYCRDGDVDTLTIPQQVSMKTQLRSSALVEVRETHLQKASDFMSSMRLNPRATGLS